MPSSIVISCCELAVDTFTRPPAGAFPNPPPPDTQPLPLLPAASFLQNCEYVASSNLDVANQVFSTGQTAQYDVVGWYGVTCPAGKSAIAGGIIQNDVRTGAQFWDGRLQAPPKAGADETGGLGWTAGCPNYPNFYQNILTPYCAVQPAPPAEVSAICCAAVPSALQTSWTGGAWNWPYPHSAFPSFNLVSTDPTATDPMYQTSLSCPPGTFVTGAGVGRAWYHSAGYDSWNVFASQNCIPTTGNATVTAPPYVTPVYCPALTLTSGSLSFTPSQPIGQQLMPPSVWAQLSCGALHYLRVRRTATRIARQPPPIVRSTGCCHTLTTACNLLRLVVLRATTGRSVWTRASGTGRLVCALRSIRRAAGLCRAQACRSTTTAASR